MLTNEQKVAEFHKKLDIDYHQDLQECLCCPELDEISDMMAPIAEELLKKFKETKDYRLLRAHLIAEEGIVELFSAMSSGDEVRVLDALADLTYVTSGAAVTFDLPLTEAFDEVHASNMTKEKQPKDKDQARVRDKGPNFRAPDLESILRSHRDKGQ